MLLKIATPDEASVLAIDAFTHKLTSMLCVLESNPCVALTHKCVGWLPRSCERKTVARVVVKSYISTPYVASAKRISQGGVGRMRRPTNDSAVRQGVDGGDG